MSDILEFEEKLSPWDIADKDIMDRTMDKVANDVQSRVRSRVDTGIDAAAAIRAQSITVRNADGGLVIKTDEKAARPGDSSVDDLFKPSTEAPFIEGGRVMFRRLREQQLSRRNLQAVKSSVEDVMSLRFKDHLEDAIKISKAENPELMR